MAQTLDARRHYNHWLIAIAVVVPTFMEVLDTTIANVALRYIAGGLSAAQVDSEWVITSYLAANAIVLPLSGWLLTRLGRRNYFLLSMAVFTLSSFLCGIATNLSELILFRVLQGIAGGGLQPCTQGVLLDSFPKEKQGQAQALFGIAALIAPVVGPALGGYITDNYSWRWIFFINVPVGLLAIAACYVLVEDPPYLMTARAQMMSKPSRFDFVGLSLLAITMVCWEVVLSKGQEWDWFGDPFYRVQVLAGLFVLCLIGLIVRESRYANPVVNLRPLFDRNFALGAIIIGCAYAVLYGQTVSLPGMLQTLFGYDATHSGLVLSPAGLFAVLLLPVVAMLLGKGMDARWLVMVGLALMAAGNYWLSQMNLDIGPWDVVWPRVVTIVGLSMIFAPLSVAVYQNIPPHLRGAAVGLFSLLRNEGGSVGTSTAQTIQERREQFHLLRINEYLDPFNPALQEYLAQLRPSLASLVGDTATANDMSNAIVDSIRQQQASSLAYFDVFWFCGVVALLLIPVVLLMRRSVAEKGAHLSAE
jgi:DHA2 family multidrug resistance protein